MSMPVRPFGSNRFPIYIGNRFDPGYYVVDCDHRIRCLGAEALYLVYPARFRNPLCPPALRHLAGIWKDDPRVGERIDEFYRQREELIAKDRGGPGCSVHARLSSLHRGTVKPFGEVAPCFRWHDVTANSYPELQVACGPRGHARFPGRRLRAERCREKQLPGLALQLLSRMATSRTLTDAFEPPYREKNESTGTALSVNRGACLSSPRDLASICSPLGMRGVASSPGVNHNSINQS